jgi:ABC-type multidrug transport system fused ATPase/permease subunit
MKSRDLTTIAALRLLARLLRGAFGWLALIAAGNLLAALGEGTSMALLALAAQTLIAADPPAAAGIVELAHHLPGVHQPFLVLLLCAVAAQAVRSGAQFLAQASAARLHAQADGIVHCQLYRQFHEVSFAQFNRFSLGELAALLNQAPTVGRMLQQANVLMCQALAAAALVSCLVWLSWPMTLAALVALALLAAGLRRVMRHVRQQSARFVEAHVQLTHRSLEFLRGMRLLRSMAREDYSQQIVRHAAAEAVAAQRRGLTWQASVTPIMEGAAVGGIALFLLAGHSMLGADGGALPRLLVFLAVLHRLLPRVTNIHTAGAKLAADWPILRRIAGMLRRDDKEYTRCGARRFEGLRHGIEFCRVTLQYVAGERPALANVSFCIPRGGTVALVGPSGGGKSSILDLLLRLYDPTAGCILVDGVDLAEFELGSWRRRLGIVSQDAAAFQLSVRENIALGRTEVTEQAIAQAAQAAGAHAFIRELHAGYDTLVGDRGERLSGGQRQRLAIARALASQPEILLLDEATSHLDARAESVITRSLAQNAGRTLVIAAHRLATVVHADEILVFEGGRIVERGSHEELLGAGGVYAQLWWRQREESPWAAGAMRDL